MKNTIKYTKSFLFKLENLIAESDFMLRYEKGHFKSGYCLLHEQKIMVVSKFYTLESKVNTLVDILQTVPLDTSRFAEESKKMYNELSFAKAKK